MKPHPWILGHRGASADAPENTLAAFQLAMQQGADGIELDVHLTADARLCVIHDDTLERTTDGVGAVGQKTMPELAALSAGSWFSSAYREESVPELWEVLELLPEGAVVNVEIKNGPVFYPGIGRVTAESLRPWKTKLHVIVSSFDHAVLQEVHRYEPELPLGLLYEAKLYNPLAYRNSLPYPVRSLHLWHQLVTDDVVKAAHDAGMLVLAYTVNKRADAERVAACGADGIITNTPGIMRDWFR
jgi:glycerophosphoryl diester phosphodiesterase